MFLWILFFLPEWLLPSIIRRRKAGLYRSWRYVSLTLILRIFFELILLAWRLVRCSHDRWVCFSYKSTYHLTVFPCRLLCGQNFSQIYHRTRSVIYPWSCEHCLKPHIAVIVFCIGVVVQTSAEAPKSIYGGRFVTGLGIGSLSMAVPLYNAEVECRHFSNFIF